MSLLGDILTLQIEKLHFFQMKKNARNLPVKRTPYNF